MAEQRMGVPSILADGTKMTKGRDSQRMNIITATIIAESIKTTLGPLGMDKLLIDSLKDVVITNDGATILREIDVDHPVGKMLVEAAITQELVVGDGTTTAAIIAGELLQKADDLLYKNIHPTIIASGYKKAAKEAAKFLEEISTEINLGRDDILTKVAITSMTGKGIEEAKEHLANVVVKAVKSIKNSHDETITMWNEYIKIVEREGAPIEETELINGVILDKERVHQSMPTSIRDAQIMLANFSLEVNNKEIASQIRFDDPEKLRAFLEERKTDVLKTIKKIIDNNTNVFFTQKNIDDFAQYYMAQAGIMSVRRVKKSDLEKLSKATGANIISNQDEFSSDEFGYAGMVEEIKLGNNVYIVVKECKNPSSVSILVRGETKAIVEEVGRSIEDALGSVASTIEDKKIVGGGGASELAISRRLMNYAKDFAGREQLAIEAFANALESIPKTLAENAGFDVIDKVSEVKIQNENQGHFMGLDVLDGKIKNMVENGIIEPTRVIKVAIDTATQVVIRILRIDDIIAAAKLKPSIEDIAMIKGSSKAE